MASSRCSVETYSSLRASASAKAASSTREVARAELRLGAAVTPWGCCSRSFSTCSLERVQRDAELLEHGNRAPLGLPQQRAQQVRRRDLAVAA